MAAVRVTSGAVGCGSHGDGNSRKRVSHQRSANGSDTCIQLLRVHLQEQRIEWLRSGRRARNGTG